MQKNFLVRGNVLEEMNFENSQRCTPDATNFQVDYLEKGVTGKISFVFSVNFFPIELPPDNSRCILTDRCSYKMHFVRPSKIYDQIASMCQNYLYARYSGCYIKYTIPRERETRYVFPVYTVLNIQGVPEIDFKVSSTS